ncbi:hypothetical protein [Nautilia sp.]
MTDIIFYFGTAVIIFAFTGLVTVKFKDEESINLNEQKWIILIYIILLITAITAWRIIYLLIISSTGEMIEYNKNIQSVIDG